MTCALCGSKSHNVRTCPLPGRDRYLKAQEHARKIHSWSKQPQKGRKPPRLGGVNKKGKKQRAVQYSGAKKVQLQQEIRNQNRKKTATLPQTLESQRAAVDTLQRLCFLQELPRICTTCRRGAFGEIQTTSTQQVFWRCIDSDCRKSQRPRSCLVASGRSSAPRIQSVSTSACVCCFAWCSPSIAPGRGFEKSSFFQFLNMKFAKMRFRE